MGAIASIKAAGATTSAKFVAGTEVLAPTIVTLDAGVGVSMSFDPEGFIQPGLAKWVDRSGGIAVGYPSITLGIRPPNKQSRVSRVMCKISLPTLESVSGTNALGYTPASARAYENFVTMEYVLHERGAEWERKLLLDLQMSLLAATITASDGGPTDATGSPLINMVRKFERVYG